MTTIKLQSLKCVKTTNDGSGKSDEVYIKIKTDGLEGRLPSDGEWSMDKDVSQDIDRTYEFVTEFYVEVMEHDTARDDDIGAQAFGANSSDWPASPINMYGEDSHYQLYFSS